jgi:hypothetical protein
VTACAELQEAPGAQKRTLILRLCKCAHGKHDHANAKKGCNSAKTHLVKIPLRAREWSEKEKLHALL